MTRNVTPNTLILTLAVTLQKAKAIRERMVRVTLTLMARMAKGRVASKSSKPKLHMCHNCGEKGHIKPNCPKLKTGNSNSSGNPNPIGSAQASSISDKATSDLFSRIKSGEVKFMNHVKVISSSTMPPRALSRPRMPERPPVGMARVTPIFPMESLHDTTTSKPLTLVIHIMPMMVQVVRLSLGTSSTT